MSKNLFAKLTGALVMLAGLIAHADDIKLGLPAYGGTGCPAGTASAVLSPDQKTLSVLFDQYQAEAGGVSGRTLDRKSCNLAIPVHVPQGFSISIFQIDYRGFAAVPYGGLARFNVEYFFAGSGGPRSSKTVRGPTNQDYDLTDRLAAAALVWSPCGASTNLRINSNLMVTSNRNLDDAIATVDSADIKAGIVYHIQWRRCR
jgi:hypothetical protein